MSTYACACSHMFACLKERVTSGLCQTTFHRPSTTNQTEKYCSSVVTTWDDWYSWLFTPGYNAQVTYIAARKQNKANNVATSKMTFFERVPPWNTTMTYFPTYHLDVYIYIYIYFRIYIYIYSNIYIYIY